MPTSKIETINAAKARKYLESNRLFTYDSDDRTNRPIVWSRVRRYAYDMLRDNWKLTNQAIGFDEDDNLVDGQHRLLAIIHGSENEVNGLGPNSDLTIATYVVRGLDPEVFDHVDIGMTRTSAQILAMDGVHNQNMLSAAARIALLFETFSDYHDWSSGSGAAIITAHDIKNFVKETDITDYVNDSHTLIPIGMIPSAAVAALYVCHKALPDGPHEKFLDSLRSGIFDGDPDTWRQNPVRALREFLIRSKGNPRTRGGRDSHKLFFCYIKAWNDFVNGYERTLVSWHRGQGVIRPVGYDG